MADLLTNGATSPPPPPGDPLAIAATPLALRDLLLERGTSGLRRAGGYVREDLLQELTGLQGVRAYRAMRDNSPVIGACLFAIEMLIRNVKWHVQPADTSDEAAAYAELLSGMLFEDLELPWSLQLSEILSFLPFGWSWFEIVLKRRQGLFPPPLADGTPALPSKFADGLIGLGKLAPRAQDTLLRWEFDATGSLLGMHQLDPWVGRQAYLPYAKSLLFRPTSYKNSPEGRALTLDTPLPTPDGWTTMGAVTVGDKIYDDRGRIRYVTGKSRVWEQRPVFDVQFSNGAVVTADAEHQWSVTTANDRHLQNAPRLMTTHALFAWLARPVQNPFFCVGGAPVLDAAILPLPLDPYILGYWLGDGGQQSGVITVEKDDYASLALQAEAAGFDSTFDGDRSAYISGIKVLLRSLGVLGQKHIPQAYLRAHHADRLALLQGLMDSDGTSSLREKDSASRWYNSNPLFLQQFCELVRSLGGTPRQRLHSKSGKICGTIRERTIIQRKDLYEIRVWLPLPLHRLPRKAAQQRVPPARCYSHYIEAIRPAGTADTVCIEVDSPSHLFLAGEGMVPTHNSVLRTAYRAHYMVTHIENTEGVGIERDLAGIPLIYGPPQWWLPSATPEEVAQVDALKTIGRNVRNDEQACLVLPSLYDAAGNQLLRFETVHAGGSKAIDTNEIIQRYELRMTQSLLCDLLFLGHEDVGSFALASSKSTTQSMSLGGYLTVMHDELNGRLVPLLWRVNAFPEARMPTLRHGDVETVDLTELARFMLSFGRIYPMQDLENHIRTMAGLPERSGAETHPLPPAIQPSGGAGSHGGGHGVGIESLQTGEMGSQVGLPDLDRALESQSL
jgi:hypothetical protein